MSESYDVGTRAWQPDATEGWVASEVIKKTVDGSKVFLEFQLENGEVRIPCFAPVPVQIVDPAPLSLML
jgi:myosin heavy subunit